jgi:hypothetical protein
LVLFEFTWKPSKYTAVKVVHISSPFIHEDGFGLNSAFTGFDYSW